MQPTEPNLLQLLIVPCNALLNPKLRSRYGNHAGFALSSARPLMLNGLRLVQMIVLTASFMNFGSSMQLEGNRDEFGEYFKKVRTVQLDPNVVVGQVTHLDIDAANHLLVTDMMAKGVFIFDAEGKLKKKLSAEPCHPGFNWRPIRAVYSPNGEIFLINSAPWGFRFKNDGDCLGPVDRSFRPPSHICFQPSGDIVGYYTLDDGNCLRKLTPLGMEIKKFGVFPDEFKQIISRYDGGGGVICDLEGKIYQVDMVSPDILVYNQNGELERKFGRTPPYYQRISEDLPASSNPMEIIRSFRKIMQGKTVTTSLYLLGAKTLLIQYMDGVSFGLDILDINGKRVVRKDIRYKNMIIQAKNGFVYIAVQHEPDKSGNLPNPVIDIYEFRQ